LRVVILVEKWYLVSRVCRVSRIGRAGRISRISRLGRISRISSVTVPNIRANNVTPTAPASHINLYNTKHTDTHGEEAGGWAYCAKHEGK
jgi:hypothetical protein